jgi:hypothetical protein
VAASTRHISHFGHAHLRCIKCHTLAVIQRRRSRPGKIPGHQQSATPRTSSPPGTTYPRPPNPVLHLMQLSPELKPNHRPPAAPPPPPPSRGQPGHDPEPATVFRVIAGQAQLRCPGAAAIGDLHPDSACAGRHRDSDRLPGKTRAAVPKAVAESSLTSRTASSSQGCPGPRTAPTNVRTTLARSASPATFTLSRTVAPVISAPPSRPPGKTRRAERTHGKSTLTSAAIVKPNTRRWRATPGAQPGGLIAHTAGENQAIRAGDGIPGGNSAGRRIPYCRGKCFTMPFHFVLPIAYDATSNAV